MLVTGPGKPEMLRSSSSVLFVSFLIPQSQHNIYVSRISMVGEKSSIIDCRSVPIPIVPMTVVLHLNNTPSLSPSIPENRSGRELDDFTNEGSVWKIEKITLP